MSHGVVVIRTPCSSCLDSGTTRVVKECSAVVPGTVVNSAADTGGSGHGFEVAAPRTPEHAVTLVGRDRTHRRGTRMWGTWLKRVWHRRSEASIGYLMGSQYSVIHGHDFRTKVCPTSHSGVKVAPWIRRRIALPVRTTWRVRSGRRALRRSSDTPVAPLQCPGCEMGVGHAR